MKKNQWICLLLLAAFVLPLIGCGEPQHVIQSNQKTGLDAEARASKRGDQ